jgi:hypothetical protein
MVLFDVRFSPGGIASLPWSCLTLESESFPMSVSKVRLTPPTKLLTRPAMDHIGRGRTCIHICRKGYAALESALLVTARTRKLDSSLMFLLSPTPLSRVPFGIDLDL